MSQYLVIFLLVAVFRGVVWVVQKVQQNAKAREAAAAAQANAQMGDAVPPAIAQRDARRGMSVSPEISRPKVAVSRRDASNASGRSTRASGRGQSRGSQRSKPAGQARAGSRKAPPPQVEPEVTRVVTASRADQREARVDQSSRDIRTMLRDPKTLRRIMLAREVLGSPRGLHV
jgi:hypothetical protein